MKKLLPMIFIVLPCFTHASEWRILLAKDEMRGTIHKIMGTDSVNTVNFAFPYSGGSKLTLVLRSPKVKVKNSKDNIKLTEVAFAIDKGQFYCHTDSDCHVSVKFDDGAIKKYPAHKADAGVSNMIFISGAQGFIKELQGHKLLIVEAPFYKEGNQQFRFDLTGYSNPREVLN